MGFKALNEQPSRDGAVQETNEAQEARIMGAYESAMQHVAMGDSEQGIVSPAVNKFYAMTV